MFILLSIKRNRLRTLLTTLGVASTLIGFLLLRTASDVWSAGLETSSEDRLITFNVASAYVPLPVRHADLISSRLEGVEATTYFRILRCIHPKDDRSQVSLTAVGDNYLAVNDDLLVEPALQTEWQQDAQGVLIGSIIAGQLDWKVGDRVKLNGVPPLGDVVLNVIGVYQPGRSTTSRDMILSHYAYLDRLLPQAQQGLVTVVTTKVKAAGSAARVGTDIDALFESSNAPTRTISERTYSKAMATVFGTLFAGLDLMSGIIMILMAMVTGNTIAMTVTERTQEYATLRALGFEPIVIGVFVVGEGVLVTFLGTALGLLAGLPLLSVVGDFMETNVSKVFPFFRVSPGSVLLAVGVSLGFGLLAALGPAIRAARTPVAGALRRA